MSFKNMTWEIVTWFDALEGNWPNKVSWRKSGKGYVREAISVQAMFYEHEMLQITQVKGRKIKLKIQDFNTLQDCDIGPHTLLPFSNETGS